jgi:transcriptional antiterminator RfaH
MPDETRGWFALYTHPHREYAVKGYLENEGLTVFLPEVKNRIQRADRPSRRPFFPNYLFLKNPGLERLPDIRWMPGLRQVVAFGSRAALVPDEIVQRIAERLQTYQEPTEERYRPGDRVRVMHGPLEGLEVVFDRRLSSGERVRVMLELLSRIQVPVEMDMRDLLPF